MSHVFLFPYEPHILIVLWTCVCSLCVRFLLGVKNVPAAVRLQNRHQRRTTPPEVLQELPAILQFLIDPLGELRHVSRSIALVGHLVQVTANGFLLDFSWIPLETFLQSLQI